MRRPSNFGCSKSLWNLFLQIHDASRAATDLDAVMGSYIMEYCAKVDLYLSFWTVFGVLKLFSDDPELCLLELDCLKRIL